MYKGRMINYLSSFGQGCGCSQTHRFLFRLFQFADFDLAEPGPIFQAVGHGGCSPTHAPEHKAATAGEERGQVRPPSAAASFEVDSNYTSRCQGCLESRLLGVGGEREGGFSLTPYFSFSLSLLLKQPTYKTAFVLMTHSVKTACLSATVNVLMQVA